MNTSPKGAGATGDWPVGLDQILARDGACGLHTLELSESQVKVMESAPRKYVEAVVRDACRMKQVFRAYSNGPASLCPGVTALTFPECNEVVFNRLEQKSPLTGSAVLIGLAAVIVGSQYFRKQADGPKAEMGLALLESMSDLLLRLGAVQLETANSASQTTTTLEKEQAAIWTKGSGGGTGRNWWWALRL